MRIIGANNPRITSVNRITYVVDLDEVVAYVNKSTLLGRYPNAYYAYEAVRGALMRCGCRDPYNVFKIPVNVVTKYTVVPTIATQFAPTIANNVRTGSNYLTWVTRFSGTTAPIVLVPQFTIDPRITILYRVSTTTITAPTSPSNALASGFVPIQSGDPILIPALTAPNDHRIRFAPYWDTGSDFSTPDCVFTLYNAMVPTQSNTPTTLSFTNA
jgi:hypothetical protein